MSNEEFSVDPEHVAGYSDLAGRTASDCHDIGQYVLEHASSDGNFGVVMEPLRGPVDDYATATDSRVSDRGRTLVFTSFSLEDTAWSYYTADGGAAQRFVVDGMGVPVEQTMPGAVQYARESGVASMLTPPGEPEEADVESLVQDHAGDTVQMIDELCRFVSGLAGDEWSPMETIINPLVGNWNALKQKGEALVIAGEAAETAASNLTTSLGTLDAHWDGGAAQEFHAYLNKLAAALDYEGALARVVSKVYDGVAWLIEWVAIGAVKAVSLAVELIRKYAPGSGWVSVAGDIFGSVLGGRNPIDDLIDDWREAWHFFEDAKAMVDMLRELPEQVRAILDMVSHPMEALTEHAESRLEGALEPLREAVSAPEVDVELEDAPSELFELGEDIVEVADIGTLTEAPTEAYAPGADLQRDGR